MIEFFDKKILAAVSKKSDGAVNFVGHPIFDDERRANRRAFLQTLGIKLDQTVTPLVQHGSKVAYVSLPNEILEMLPVDAVMTDKKNLALTMGMGDCPTLFLHDPVNEVIALVHCGWKSLVAGIVEKTLNGMRLEYNVNPTNLKAYIGPGICQACFEVGMPVAMQFENTYQGADGKYRVNLHSVIVQKLVSSKLIDKNVEWSKECTKHTTYQNKQGQEKPKYFSFRRDRSDPLETNVAVMMMRE